MTRLLPTHSHPQAPTCLPTEKDEEDNTLLPLSHPSSSDDRTHPPPGQRRSWVRLLLGSFLVALVICSFAEDGGMKAAVHRSCSRLRSRKDPFHKAREVLKRYPLIDGHVDIPVLARYVYNNSIDSIPFDAEALPNGTFPMAGHVDIPRLRQGLAGGLFWSAYVECPPTADIEGEGKGEGQDTSVRDTMEQFDVIRQMVERFPRHFELVSTASQARHAFKRGKMASFIGLEGGHSLGDSLFALRAFAAMFTRPGDVVGPLRYLTLTHTCHNVFADSSGPETPRWDGLSPFGHRLITELNRLGIVPDISHVSDSTALQTITATRGAVMLSHSSARGLHSIPRNVPDSVLHSLSSAIRKGGKEGVVMINIYPAFLGDNDDGKKADLERRVEHIDYVSAIVGRSAVGLGTDFDGIDETPRGLEDVRAYPALVAKLVERGWTEKEVAGFVGGNVLRVLERAERDAVEMRREGVRPDWTRWGDVSGHM